MLKPGDDEDAEPPVIDPADLPPVLDWERDVYDVYSMVRTQWIFTMAGRAAFNHDAALRIAARRGYDEELFQDLLRTIEYAVLKNDAADREDEKAKSGRPN